MEAVKEDILEIRTKLDIRLDLDTAGREICKKQKIIFDKDNAFKIWNNEEKRYKEIDITDLQLIVKKACEVSNLCDSNLSSKIITSLKMGGRENLPKEIGKYEIQFREKIVNYLTGEEREVSSRDLTFNAIPHKLGKSEETPIINRIMMDWLKDEKEVEKLQEWFAYCMTNNYDFDKFALFFGGGADGKTTAIDLLTRLIGKDNTTAGDFTSIFITRFGTSNLYHKLALFMSELDFGVLSKTGIFKSATGDDLILVEFKNRGAFSYKNYCKPIISSNSPPITLDKTGGFYRRPLIFTFKGDFEDNPNKNEKVLDIVTKEEYENFCLKSLRLLKKLHEEKKFTNEGTLEERKEHYEKISNPLAEFLREYTIEDANGFLQKSALKRELNKWLKSNRYRTYTSQELGKLMSADYEQGFKPRVENDWNQGTERAWIGLKWKK